MGDDSELIVYARPDPSSEPVDTLYRGAVVHVLGEMDRDGWLQVRAERTGYVDGDYVVVRRGLQPTPEGYITPDPAQMTPAPPKM